MKETVVLVGFISVLIFTIVIVGMILICRNERFAQVITKIVKVKIDLNIGLNLKKGGKESKQTKK